MPCNRGACAFQAIFRANHTLHCIRIGTVQDPQTVRQHETNTTIDLIFFRFEEALTLPLGQQCGDSSCLPCLASPENSKARFFQDCPQEAFGCGCAAASRCAGRQSPTSYTPIAGSDRRSFTHIRYSCGALFCVSVAEPQKFMQLSRGRLYSKSRALG